MMQRQELEAWYEGPAKIGFPMKTALKVAKVAVPGLRVALAVKDVAKHIHKKHGESGKDKKAHAADAPAQEHEEDGAEPPQSH